MESCESSSGRASDAAAVPVDDWSRPFEWDSQADDIRFNVFGISKYRANQREVGPLHPVYIYFLQVVLQGFAFLQFFVIHLVRASAC